MALESLGRKPLEQKIHKTEAYREEMRLQMDVARFAYDHRTEEEKRREPAPAKIDGNTVMRWWLKEGLALEWGMYVEKHPNLALDEKDEEQLANIVAELRRNKNTLH